MIINNDAGLLNPSVAGAGSSAASSTRQSGRWMAELERALIAEQPAQEQGKTPDGNPAKAAANPAPEDHSRQEQGEQRQASNVPAESRAKSNTNTNAQTTSHADAPSSNRAMQAQRTADRAQSAEATPKVAVPQAPAQKASAPPAKASQVTAKAATARAREVAHVTDQSAIPVSAAAIVAAPVQLESMLGAALRSYAAAGPVSATQAPVTALTSGRAAAGEATALGASSKGNPTAGEPDEVVSEMSAGADEASATETESYAPRHMHLVQDGEGVRAWIRDAGLTQPQAVMVAQSLVGELHQSGLKLNGLVLNGKRVGSLFQGNQYQNHESFAVDEQSASIADSTASNPHHMAAPSSIDQRGEV